MKITPIKTYKITTEDDDLFNILDRNLLDVKEKSIIGITSKIVSIAQGRVVGIEDVDKETLIEQEADYYLPLSKQPHGVMLTIKDNILIPTAGIDESNGNGYYVLWPKNPQKTANRVRKYLLSRFHLQYVGVIITDSKTSPLRRGTTGITLAHSGFRALNSYIGKPDIFGRKLTMTKANVADALGAAAVLVMGEGREQTPLAIIEDVPFITFQKRHPSKKKLQELTIGLDEDLYAPLLTNASWKTGKK